jgi:uncharacterized protein involved in exopolysaccharide biosynthesis
MIKDRAFVAPNQTETPDFAGERDSVLHVPNVIPELEDDGREKILEALWLLWRRRSFLFRAALVGLLTSVSIAFLIPKQYTSTTRLMPPDRGSGSGMQMLAALAGKGAAALGSLGGDLFGLKTTGDLFIGILESRTVQDNLVNQFNLKSVYGVRRREEARKDLAERTDITQDRKSGIIAIAVTDKSPQRAAAMAEQYVSELNHVVTDLNTSSAHKERVFLEERLTEVKKKLESAENDFSQFASKNTTIDIQEQGKAILQAGSAIEGQVIATQTELDGLRQIYTDNNIRVREAQARLNDLQGQLQKLSGRAEAGSSGSDSDSTALYPSLRKLPLLGVNYADLYRQMKVQEAVYDTLTQQYELARVEEAKETPTVQVLDPAEIPSEKSFPHRWVIVLVGLFLAISTAVVWVVGSSKWDGLSPSDPRKALAHEVFHTAKGVIPWASRNGHHSEGQSLDLSGPSNDQDLGA